VKFDQPAGQNPIDQLKVIGHPVDRIDGALKTTGTATYAYEQSAVAPNAAYGYILPAGIAKGRIASIDLTRANDAPGVLTIITHENAGKIDKGNFYVARALAGPDVDHYHQAVAVVVAETFEQARAAANLIRLEYVRAPGVYDLAAQKDTAPAPTRGGFGPPPENRVGDFEAAFASAPVKVDQTYTTPDQTHAMMEPHAAIAVWEGDTLTCYTSVQMMNWSARDLARTLGINRSNVRVVAPYVGGGFGGKTTILADAVMASLAARAVGRPVKVALQRAMMMNNTSHRPATIQRIRLAATPDGTLTAIGHESWSGNMAGGGPEASTIPTRLLYASPNRMTRLRLATLDLPEGSSMRAPGETPGMMALEIAMDEMAEKLGLDPVEFRILNDTQIVPGTATRPPSTDPQSTANTQPDGPGQPFSIRQFVKCLRTGADTFGWNGRNPKPGQTRQGQWLIGHGVASAIRGGPVMPCAARVRLSQQGVVTVETDMTDIGTGSYTIIAQTAAEMMGVALEKVVVRLGDSSFPVSPGAAGQWGAASVTAAVYAACMTLREAVAKSVGVTGADVTFAEGHVEAGGRRVPLADAATPSELVAEERMEYGDLARRFAMHTFGAHFVEVAVHAFTGETRVRRWVAVCAAGRILNPKLARSQVMGGITMGIGGALTEELAVDKRAGFFVNHDLAGYEVPVHADIPRMEIIFLDEVDPYVSPLKAKGVGELGICGAAAAVANAIYNATGIRVREYPITIDKLIDQLST
jgi:xanthine dehydrogenase YagR molybdenum-binding subunit